MTGGGRPVSRRMRPGILVFSDQSLWQLGVDIVGSRDITTWSTTGSEEGCR